MNKGPYSQPGFSPKKQAHRTLIAGVLTLAASGCNTNPNKEAQNNPDQYQNVTFQSYSAAKRKIDCFDFRRRWMGLMSELDCGFASPHDPLCDMLIKTNQQNNEKVRVIVGNKDMIMTRLEAVVMKSEYREKGIEIKIDELYEL